MIVLHAGMPKAGSSTIQRWLQESARDLRREGLTVVHAPRTESGEIVFESYERGTLNSGWIIDQAVSWSPVQQKEMADALVEALAKAASKYGDIVVSGESFAHPFWALHEDTLTALQHLSTLHRLRVAYYVRPQHAILEAAWRQWGFRSGHPPSVYVPDYATHLHHATTRSGVNSLGPGLEFEPRPLREDLLDDGDLISDFAGRFLGIQASPTAERVNVGLPLEAANLLSAAPAGMLWSSTTDNLRIDRVKRLLDGNSLPEDDRIALSRLVLRRYAHELFSDENSELGWVDFVPPPSDKETIPGIQALDELWAPQASPAELELIFRALNAGISDPSMRES